jgi:hypothetical protein
MYLERMSTAEKRLLNTDEVAAIFGVGRRTVLRWLVGSEDDNLIPEGGDVMFYGDGGTAKTTLAVDLAYHMGSAKDWLGYAIAQPARVLLIENEGPRALFRLKLKRKDEAWAGPPTEDRISVLERPWATFTFATPDWRERLAKTIIARRISVVIAGPVVTLGMNTAGTLQEVRAFMKLIADLRTRIDWPLTVILIHHENKGGAVSGAWEGAGDTLMHTSGAGHGHTILFVQKARWASASHHTTLKLAWADGDGFDVEGDRDLMAEVRALFQENAKPRTKEELGDELGVSKNTVADLIKENPNAFDELTGEAARALGRHPTSKLYILASEVVPASGPPGTTS